MVENTANVPKRRRLPLVVSALIVPFILLTVVHTILAQDELLPPDLSASYKTVSSSEAKPGSTLKYTVGILNSGDSAATDVVMTDTLQAGLDFVSGTLSVKGGGWFGYDAGVITWTGSISSQAEVRLTFHTVLTGTIGDVITNTATISGAGALIERWDTTTVVSETTATGYLPLVMRRLPVVTLLNITGPDSSNNWTLNWTSSDVTRTTGYEIQEDHSPDFSSPTVIPVGPTTSFLRSQPLSVNNVYYYRVRGFGSFGVGPWSNVLWVVGGYRDGFDAANTGWTMRRQDTDDTANQVYYRNGHLVLEMDSRFDYLLASSLAPAPSPPYRLEASIQLVGVDNTHAYGMVFGGDWDGSACPNSVYSSCFNHYYRLLVVYTGSANGMRFQLKRIDYHEAPNNTGRGVDIISWRNVTVNSPSRGYQRWAVEVYPGGLLNVFVNDNLVGQGVDTTYLGDRYFGAFSAVDEYTGLEAEFDWYQVTRLP